MPNISLEDIYRNLSPVSINSSNVIRKSSIFDILADCLYDPNGKAYTFKKIKSEIEKYYTGNNLSYDEKKDLKDNFHGIGTSKIISDDTYWSDYKPTQHFNKSSNKDSIPEISVFSIRGPNISPAKRGTKQIDFFLNYTPPIVSAQMVPYLDVRFKTKDTAKSNITTPSIIRFLLGSGPIDNLKSNDKFIQTADTFKNGTTRNENEKIIENESSVFGMEMFLMPQTLTNMEALGESKTNLTRLVRAKPFVPFASIEGFDVNVVNAGAGSFAHKKATLKLKIHDKSRIGEIADFIRGSSGFSKVTIETTYGWSAPSNRGSEDEYCKFINDNMRITELWQTSNTQFSFDGSGQVSLNIEMVSQAGKIFQNATIAGAETGVEKFYEAIKVIDQTKRRLTGETKNNFSVTATTEKFFNAASTNGIFIDLKDADLKKSVEELKTLAAGKLSNEESESFNKSLNIITNSESDWSRVKTQLSSHIQEKFNNLSLGNDPFIPRKIEEYFSDSIIKTIEDKRKNKPAEPAQTKTKNEDLSITVNGIASFGKVFLDFIVPQIDKQMCDEVQVFFYGLNDECGYISGCSVAEVPIDLNILSNAYSLKVKELGTRNLQIETLLGIISDTHFSDLRAIGFGMNSFYKPWDKTKPGEAEVSDDKTIQSTRIKWIQDNGDINIPTIEMFTEIVESFDESKNIVKIKRIHIYDKKNTPYSFEQKIFDNGDGNYSLGNSDKGALRKLKKELVTHFALESKSYQELNEFFSSLDTGKLDPELSSKISSLNINVTKTASGVETIKIGDRGALKNYLLKKVPSLTIGTNGSLIFNSSVSSKTDNLQGAINLINASKGTSSSKASPSSDGLGDINELPIRSVPMQVTLSSLGVPTAQLYQKFFIDFNTGTTIDNIYVCSQIQHSMTQGKFTTNWTFIYDNGYGKFTSPPTIKNIMSGFLSSEARDLSKEKEPKQATPKK